MIDKKRILAIFSIIVLALIGNTWYSLRNIAAYSNDAKLLAHTLEVHNALSDNLSLLQDVETGSRGYVITGKADFLEPYFSALKKLPLNSATLRELTRDNPQQQKMLDSLDLAAAQKIAISKGNIETRQQGGLEDAAKKVSTGTDKEVMDDYLAIIRKMQQAESSLLAARSAETEKSLGTTQYFILLGGIFSVIVVLFYLYSMQRAAKLEAELLLSNALSEKSVKAKQQFLSNMSHEIRTPMNAIIGFTKVVLRTDLTAKQREYLTAIKLSGDALIVLINDILDLAKVDSGKMTFEQMPFKLETSFAAMLHLFEIKIDEKNLKLIKEYDTNIPEVLLGDPVRLHQIILNLVSNAVKFTTKGSIRAGVRLLHEDAQKASLEFSVSDTGIGIEADKLPNVFENFQQASSETTRLYGGTGLGLAIVKQLVEAQGGTVSVESSLGKGSTFTFNLDFMKTNEKIEPETSTAEIDIALKNIQVLVVEDMALNQLLMQTLLDDFGFHCDMADNGKIALEKLKAKVYDIILMDLQMPEMNGFEATEHIRNTLHSGIPIIALTADVTTVDLEKCKAVGMDDYIAKPVDENLLYNKIVNLVRKHKLSRLTMQMSEDKNNQKRYVDLTYLNQRTKSNPVLMQEMIALYLEQTPPLVQAMKQSFQVQNWPALHAAVHKMIPSFSIVGINPDFENMAKKIQEYAHAELQNETIHDLVFQLETVCTQACQELEEALLTIKHQNTKTPKH